ncbi:solute carrier family 26 protein [Aliifodinibius salicampi]|uniref:Solute carrier family 26 protein n=1 Tax=Fodinibius salicampi TaxID=1920655 RepID=A0ABT3Q279_9BACT|nr:solute carrier family 26 protein [Fodinibius salicampi]MCW9714203.1 solute carrier family 26 protein [Fodinibius salicampi]
MKEFFNKISPFVPMAGWIRSYSSSDLKGDLNAGITVGIMLIPQGMAYAVLAGLPPIYGLYASLVPLVLYAIFGTSRQLAVGPVAMVSLLVVAGVGEIAEVGSDRFIQLAIMTALGVGVFQLLMGVFRMGFLVNFLSHPVLSGFTSAAALIIGASQFKNLFGIDLPRTNYVHEILLGLFEKAANIEPYTAAIGIGSIVLIILVRKWKPTFPSALVVVVLGTLVTFVFGLHQKGVVIVGEIPQGLPSLEILSFNLSDFQQLLPTILVISLVGYMESIAVAKAIANKHGYKVDPNQELIGLGVANIGGAFFQSYPTTGGFSRTAVNDQAGARTGMATIISAAIIALTVLLLTPLFYYLPMAVLASIIMVAVAGLFDINEMKYLWKTDRKDLAMLATTFVATLVLGIEEGILVGVVLSLVVVIYSSTRPHSTELGRLGDTKNFRNVKRYPEAKTDDKVLIYRFDSQLFFANVTHFRDKLDDLIDSRNEELQLLILDASSIHDMDSTGIHALRDLIEDLQERGLDLYIAGAIGPVRDKLKTCDIVSEMGKNNFFFDVNDALATFYSEQNMSKEYEYSPLQTNN